MIYYQSYEQFNLTVEYKYVIRVTAEINIYSWHDEELIYKLCQQIIKLLFIKKLVRVINKNYDRSVKESSLSPPESFRTQVSALASAYHLQQGRTNPEYSIIHRMTYRGRHYGRQQLRMSFKANRKLLMITIEVQQIPWL